MFSDHAKLDKSGIVHLNEAGAYAVIANRTLHEKGQAAKFAVVNVPEEWVDSVHKSRDAAWTLARKL